MDIVNVESKTFLKEITWDLVAIEMSDTDGIHKILEEGYEPFSAVPHIKKSQNSILTQSQAPGGVITDNLIFFRRGNVKLSPISLEKIENNSASSELSNE